MSPVCVAPIALSLAEARRLALAAQGFNTRNSGAERRPVTLDHLRKLATQLNAFQIDSVNVLVRAHYVPAFARLGPYPMAALDTLAYSRRELFEYWGHAACLLPVALYPLLRYRMHAELTHEYMRSERGAYLASVYTEVAERGPLSAAGLSNPGRRSGNWWGWGTGKAALEYLYDSGLVAIAGRRGFERLYDITDRVIPRVALEQPAPPPEEAMKQLMCRAAQAYGVGTAHDIAGYFNVDGWRDRLSPGPYWERTDGTRKQRARPIARRLIGELVEEGRLLRATVEGWNEPAYMHTEVRIPRRAHHRALVTPFDSLVWERARVARLFGMKYSISLYTPADKREHGYYVLPFLLGDTLVARCDLKADRQRRVLLVQSAFIEPEHDARYVATELAAELREWQVWLQLDTIEVNQRGDLSCELTRALEDGRAPTFG